ncbi:MAG: phasin family protein [Rudaea sp.]|nr:phasin family protein [Rudaea sp.]
MSKPKLKTRPKARPAPKVNAAAKAKPKLKASPAAATAHESKAVAGKSIMESAQHIWLAGLGAFAKAQGEGSKLFDALVKQGSSLEQQTRKIATGKVEEVRGAVESSVSQVRERTQETWDRLEQVFESRVSHALSKLGVPGRKELDELLARVDELNREVKKLNGSAPKTSLGRVMSNTVRRARDDLSDLARELEEAQLAAKSSAKRTIAKVKKTIRSATR